MIREWQGRFILVLAFLAALPERVARAEPLDQYEPYCGLFAVHAVAVSLGTVIRAEDLFVPKYLMSREGSSLAELEAACRDNALHTIAVTNLSLESLSTAGCPVILHVKADIAAEKYDHWVAVLRVAGGSAIVQDVPREPTAVPLHQLEMTWDGAALLVSDKPISLGRIRFGEFVPWGAGGVGLLSLICVTQYRQRHARVAKSTARGVLAQCLVLGGTAALASLAYAVASPDGMVRDAALADAVASAHLDQWLDRVSTSDVSGMIAKGDVAVVDARAPQDYVRGHLPGAISIPATLEPDGFAARVAALPSKSHVVVYCQSRNCTFSNQVARKLYLGGRRGLAIYTDGYEAWRSATDARAKEKGTSER